MSHWRLFMTQLCNLLNLFSVDFKYFVLNEKKISFTAHDENSSHRWQHFLVSYQQLFPSVVRWKIDKCSVNNKHIAEFTESKAINSRKKVTRNFSTSRVLQKCFYESTLWLPAGKLHDWRIVHRFHKRKSSGDSRLATKLIGRCCHYQPKTTNIKWSQIFSGRSWLICVDCFTTDLSCFDIN